MAFHRNDSHKVPLGDVGRSSEVAVNAELERYRSCVRRSSSSGGVRCDALLWRSSALPSAIPLRSAYPLSSVPVQFCQARCIGSGESAIVQTARPGHSKTRWPLRRYAVPRWFLHAFCRSRPRTVSLLSSIANATGMPAGGLRAPQRLRKLASAVGCSRAFDTSTTIVGDEIVTAACARLVATGLTIGNTATAPSWRWRAPEDDAELPHSSRSEHPSIVNRGR